MRIFTSLIPAFILLIAGTVSANSAPKLSSIPSGYRPLRQTQHNIIEKTRFNKAAEISGFLSTDKKTVKSATINPDVMLGPVNQCGTLDGPNNEIWYYSASMNTKVIEHNSETEFYTEYIHLDYTFNIYDADMNEVGSISDKVRYADDEIRCVLCDLVPTVTQHFFNNDDNYEVMISFGINTTTPGLNHYRTYAYSIGGEKETVSVEDAKTGEMISKVVDKPIYTIEDSVGTVFNASHGGNDQYFICVYDETMPDFYYEDDDDADGSGLSNDEFWNQIMKSKITVNTYGKVQADGKLAKVHTFEFPTLCVPGDQQDSPYVLTFMHDNEPYMACIRYAEPFWNPYGPSDDQTMRESNSLQIRIYKLTDTGSTEVQATDIGFTKDTSNPDVLATFMGIGDLRYNEDISYGNFTTDGKASFYVTQNNYTVGESSEMSYFVYNPDGKKIKNLFRDADSTLPLSEIPGCSPQQMFVSMVGSDYIFNFVDLLTCNTVCSINYMFYPDEFSDPEMLTSNMDRIQDGDSYKYAFEMRVPLADDEDNTIMRIAWFNTDGTLSNIDEINLGQNVLYAQSYIENAALRPGLYEAGGPRAYMLLVKRGVSDTGNEEQLVIAEPISAENPTGKILFEAGPDEHGVLQFLYLNPSETAPMLTVSRYTSETRIYYWDFYYLPFGSSAINEIEAGSQMDGISFDGCTLTSEGNVINVYDLNGAMIASGFGSVEVSSLGTGVYVAAANGKVCKFIVK